MFLLYIGIPRATGRVELRSRLLSTSTPPLSLSLFRFAPQKYFAQSCLDRDPLRSLEGTENLRARIRAFPPRCCSLNSSGLVRCSMCRRSFSAVRAPFVRGPIGLTITSALFSLWSVLFACRATSCLLSLFCSPAVSAPLVSDPPSSHR